MKNYIFWIKKWRAFYEEARTTNRDTALSFAYDGIVYYFEVIYVEKGVLWFKTISVQNLLCIRQRYAIDV